MLVYLLGKWLNIGELIALYYAPYAMRKRGLSYIHSEIAHLWGNFGYPLECLKFLLIFLVLICWFGLKIVACAAEIFKLMIFLGASSFLLLFGGYGSIEIRLFLKTAQPTWSYISLVSRLWESIFTVWVKLKKPSIIWLFKCVGSNHPVDWFKLNSEGAALGNSGKAGRGGLIRDHQGKWVKGYVRHIGFASSIIVEFWALKDGLLLAS